MHIFILADTRIHTHPPKHPPKHSPKHSPKQPPTQTATQTPTRTPTHTPTQTPTHPNSHPDTHPLKQPPTQIATHPKSADTHTQQGYTCAGQKYIPLRSDEAADLLQFLSLSGQYDWHIPGACAGALEGGGGGGGVAGPPWENFQKMKQNPAF